MATLAQAAFSDRARAYDDESGRIALTVTLAIATLAHATLGLGPHAERPAPRPVYATEIELAPPPLPAPVVEPETVTQPSLHEAPQLRTSAPRAAAPSAARAGALLAAKSDPAKAQSQDAPVDFVTDPNGTSYGGGVVSRGGTADVGLGASPGGTPGGTGKAPATAITTAKGDGLTPASSLSRPARLTEPDACRGYYPAAATYDAGSVTLTVVVRPGGEVSSAAVLAESPSGQGFGHAARTCLLSKRFSPALDKEGTPVSAAATIHVRFSR